MTDRIRRALPRVTGAFLALSLVAATPAAAQILHEAAEHAGIPYLHRHGGLVHSHPHGDRHHSADGFAAWLVPAAGDSAPSPVATASVLPSAAPALRPSPAVSVVREDSSVVGPLDAKRAPPGARGPPDDSAVIPAALA